MKQQAPDWRIVIEQIVASGMTELEIAKSPDVDLTLRAVAHLRSGVQPLYRRGAALVLIWCQRTGLPVEAIPTAPVLRGHRKGRERVDLSPKLLELPVWPPVEQQGKKRRVKEAA